MFFTNFVTIAITLCFNYCIALIVEDIYIPENCDNVVSDDHLLIDYKFVFANNSIGMSVLAPNQLFHVQLSDFDNDLALVKCLKQMCQNSTRSLHFESSFGVDFSPFLHINSSYSRSTESITLIVHISTVTAQYDFSIFDAINSGNNSMVLDLIEEHRGMNTLRFINLKIRNFRHHRCRFLLSFHNDDYLKCYIRLRLSLSLLSLLLPLLF